jgi:hypothetical protein
MTTPMDDTLTVIGRQLSVTYLPTVLEPLPRELNNMVAQLVAFEMRKREPKFVTLHSALRSSAAT